MTVCNLFIFIVMLLNVCVGIYVCIAIKHDDLVQTAISASAEPFMFVLFLRSQSVFVC
jgi:hypothetical protein